MDIISLQHAVQEMGNFLSVMLKVLFQKVTKSGDVLEGHHK